MARVIVQQGVRYARYDSGGYLESWWRREKGQKSDYVERLGVFTGLAFEYDVKLNEPEAHPETDGWPRKRDVPKQKRARPRAEDLI